MNVNADQAPQIHAILNGLLGSGVSAFTYAGETVKGTLRSCHQNRVRIETYTGSAREFTYAEVMEVSAL